MCITFGYLNLIVEADGNYFYSTCKFELKNGCGFATLKAKYIPNGHMPTSKGYFYFFFFLLCWNS